MKRYLLFAIFLLSCIDFSTARAQGAPQYQFMRPGYTHPQGFSDTFPVSHFSQCNGVFTQNVYDLDWFQPVLPPQGTITAIYFRIPRKEENWKVQQGSPYRYDTILAGSAIKGIRIRMTLYNEQDIYSIDSCIKVKALTTVFNTPVFVVPNALQGDDSAHCWLKLPLDNPFSYNVAAPIGEPDTTPYRNLVMEMITDSNNRYIYYDLAKPFLLGYMAYHVQLPNVLFSNKATIRRDSNSCTGHAACYNTSMFPVIGFDLAPNSIEPEEVASTGGVYPNPVGADGRLHFKPVLLGQPYRLYNLQGILLAEGRAEQGGINLSGLPPGMYLLYCGRDRYKVMK